MELAGHLKIPTIRKLLAELDSRDYARWRIMYRLGAFGAPSRTSHVGQVLQASRPRKEELAMKLKLWAKGMPGAK